MDTFFTVALSVLSFILAVISVITVIVTLRQNNRMLESSSRPYISIYFDYTNMGEPIGYFVVKNFGKTSAKIKSLSYNDIVERQPKSLCNVSGILNGLIGNSIAPNQKFLLPIKLCDSPDGICCFNVSYESNGKTYDEKFEIIVKQYGKMTKSRISNENGQKLIYYSLQEISERLM